MTAPNIPKPNRPQPNAGVMTIEAYVPGKAAAHANVAKVYKLSANENPLGPSPKAVEAVHDVPAHVEYYPDGRSTKLREAIAVAHGLNSANIMATNGSGEALALLARVYLGQGDEAIITEHGFLTYKIYTR
jgi:histidinol-phosphate aminotransferase